MSGSNRGICIIVAIVVFGVIGLTIANESRCQRLYFSDYSQNKADIPNNSNYLRFDRNWLPCIVERETANPDVDGTIEKEQRDLIAQEAMALWAFWVAVFAGITALITSAGTILIWRQVSLTRVAVKDTSDATKAMLRQNVLTEQAQRPWLSVKIIKIENLHWDKDGRFRADYIFEVSNSGVSPAVIANEYLGIEPIKDGKIDVSSFIKSAQALLQGKSSAVPPGATVIFAANNCLIDTSTISAEGRWRDGKQLPTFAAGVAYLGPQPTKINATILSLIVTGDVLNPNRDINSAIKIHIRKTHMT